MGKRRRYEGRIGRKYREGKRRKCIEKAEWENRKKKYREGRKKKV